MTPDRNIDLDLTISRIIRASRQLVRSAWADPRSFEQWWSPAPLECRVVAMDMRPGGAFVTRMRDSGGPYAPHLSACFLDIRRGGADRLHKRASRCMASGRILFSIAADGDRELS